MTRYRKVLILSCLLALAATPYYLKLDPLILDHPLSSMELSPTDKILLVNYTFFFLSVIFLPFSLFIVFLSGKFRKLKTPLLRFSCLKRKSARKIVARICFILIFLSASVSIFGFFLENRGGEVSSELRKSDTKEDINVILIVIDALRSDHLGCYGYKRETSPHMDFFAGRGVLFKNCYTQSSWTKPSVASILTSLHPDRHGTTLHAQALPGELITLAEILRAEGYVTYGFVANPNLKKIFNFDQGFDFFDDQLMRDRLYYGVLRELRRRPPYLLRILKNRFDTHLRDNARLANGRIFPWLERHKNENFFMYIHYMDPHSPFIPPPPYDEMFPYLKGDRDSRTLSLYDGEIRFVDAQIGRLLKKLESLKIYDKTMIVITSDHGQAFGEHGDYGHGATIYQDQLKVPLLIKFPGGSSVSRIIDEPARSIDIIPTILEVLGIYSDLSLEGASLLPRLKDGKSPGDIYIEENLDNLYILKGIIRNNQWKYILTEKSEERDIAEEGSEELYNITDDPGELNNLAQEETGIMRIMRSSLSSFQDRLSAPVLNPASVKMDPETRRQLRALGYLR